MALKRISALCVAVFILLLSAICPAVEIPSVNTDKAMDSALPLSLSGTHADRMFFLPVYEKGAGINLSDEISLLPGINIPAVGYIFTGTFLPMYLFVFSKDVLYRESICPRAP